VLQLGASLPGQTPAEVLAVAQLAETLGYDSVWRAEAYGGDAVSVLGFVAARTARVKLGTNILQMPGRTPAMTAMSAVSLDLLSGGRLVLGLGVSGPQVVEGWHGVPFEAPLATTEDYVAIVRKILAGDAKVEHDGRRLSVPFRGEGATGLGKPIRPTVHSRPDIPILLAAIGPKNVALARRIADGIEPMLWNPHRWKDVYGEVLGLDDGRPFQIAATVPVALGDDLDACRDKVRPVIAMYIGGMGAKGKNFYNELVRRYGFDEAADLAQERYLAGDRAGAVAAVPDALVDEVALLGPREHVAEQLNAWRHSPVTTMVLTTSKEAVLRTMAELVL
jgi:F420-dependent oxidoreductase-like protein